MNSGFTINNKTSVNAAPVDVLVTGKPAKINLKFFAYADKDHMPLRRVMIDWDDGLGGILPRRLFPQSPRRQTKAGAVRQTRQNPIVKICYSRPYVDYPDAGPPGTDTFHRSDRPFLL